MKKAAKTILAVCLTLLLVIGIGSYAYGSEDGVMDLETYEKNRDNLPADTMEIVLNGGCHAQFGSYGPQDGDGVPAISGEEQIRQTAEAISAFIGQ